MNEGRRTTTANELIKIVRFCLFSCLYLCLRFCSFLIFVSVRVCACMCVCVCV